MRASIDDLDRYDRTTTEARALLRQARSTFARYVLSKARLSWRGSLYGTSITLAMHGFYQGLTGKLDERLGAEFGAQVVETCSTIAHAASAGPRIEVLSDFGVLPSSTAPASP